MKLKEILFGGSVKNAAASIATYTGSAQEWLPIQNIIGGVVMTKDLRFIKILEVLPVNIRLKSPIDRQTIISYYASYLKVAPDNLQIRVTSQKANLTQYFERMRRFAEAEESEACRRMILDNIEEATYLAATTAISTRFFLIFQYEPQMKARANTAAAIAERLSEVSDTARRYLDLCGLELIDPEYTDNAVLELLYELINKRTSRRVKLPPGVFDMVTEIHGVYE
ncbi:MAG: hypothetical protein RR450_06805 [Oscillospiraceae bacterium]